MCVTYEIVFFGNHRLLSQIFAIRALIGEVSLDCCAEVVTTWIPSWHWAHSLPPTVAFSSSGEASAGASWNPISWYCFSRISARCCSRRFEEKHWTAANAFFWYPFWAFAHHERYINLQMGFEEKIGQQVLFFWCPFWASRPS